ncbi:MAG: DUF1287 domain-containing protein [Armatimonadetes bacterium]|nr:DUF1287 domain-containing protein [Armatimonadota bacterium]
MLPAPEAEIRERAATPVAEKIVHTALAQIGTIYDPGYFEIAYPNGDLPADKGVCTDVVIRSLRAAGHDLQKLMNEDMSKNFGKYPTRYGLGRPDSNIDHRRVPNQLVFMKRFARDLPMSTADTKSWLPGDIVYWKMSPSLDHCGIVSNKRNSYGLPLLIDNAGTCVEEDALTRWAIVGHFRYP